jgi:DNA adenine methylase
MKPFLKWAGGKRQLLKSIIPLIEEHLGPNSTYYEPFLGGGAVFFTLAHRKANINDLNEDLINCYNVIKSNPSE